MKDTWSPKDKYELWQQFFERRDQHTRSELIMSHDNLVRTIAATIYKKQFGDDIEFDELYQMGMLGLIQSIDRYVPEKGASFETFATYRIRGAILNSLEEHSEKRSQSSFRARKKNARVASLLENQDSKPRSAFDEMVELTLGLAIGLVLEDTGLVEGSRSLNDDSTYQSNKLKELRDVLEASVMKLPQRERQVIQFHYFHRMNFSVVAEILGVTKGRVSQLHSRALQRLHQNMGSTEKGLDTYL